MHYAVEPGYVAGIPRSVEITDDWDGNLTVSQMAVWAIAIVRNNLCEQHVINRHVNTSQGTENQYGG